MTPEQRARAITFPSGKRGHDFSETLRIRIAATIRSAETDQREQFRTLLQGIANNLESIPYADPANREIARQCADIVRVWAKPENLILENTP